MNTPALSPKMDIRKSGKRFPPQKRDEITDIAKGIGILLVVALHCGIGFMAGVDMPLFFFISGFFAPTLAKCPFAEGLKRKSVDLLKPTFLFFSGYLLSFFAGCRKSIPLFFNYGKSMLSVFFPEQLKFRKPGFSNG